MFPWLDLYSTCTDYAEHLVAAAVGSVGDDLDCDLFELLNLSIGARLGYPLWRKSFGNPSEGLSFCYSLFGVFNVPGTIYISVRGVADLYP